MMYIPTVASGISTSKELQDALATTRSMKTHLDRVKTIRQENLANVTKEKVDALERANESTKQLLQCIEELGNKTTNDIIEKYKELEAAINDDLNELNKLMNTLEDAHSKLQKSLDNDTKLFVHLKQSQKAVSESWKLSESCKSNIGQEHCLFETNDSSLQLYLKGRASLGNLHDHSKYSSVNMRDVNIKGSADTCDITGICSFNTRGIIISDWNNDCIKMLDIAFQVESECELPGKPFDVCQTSPTEVAISMWMNEKIQFASIGQTISLTRSFNTSGNGYCKGIACKDGNLYVSRETEKRVGSVQIYDMTGNLIQTIRDDKWDIPIFSRPHLIATSARSSNIYVADYDNGLIILDKSGQLVAKITDPDLKGAYGVCVLPGDQLLVCGYNSHNVIQFDGRGMKVKTLLTEEDGLKEPVTLYFDPGTFRLLVGMADSKQIKVFGLLRM